MAKVEHVSFKERLQQLMNGLEASHIDEAAAQLNDLHSGEVATLLEALPPKDR